MDDDFIFEEVDDEELLNATNFLDSYEAEVNMDSTVDSKELKLLCFHCTGEDSINHTFHRNSFIRNCDRNDYLATQFFGFDFNCVESLTCNDILNVCFNKSRVNIQMLDVSSREDGKSIANKSYFEIRAEVTEFLLSLKNLVVRDVIQLEDIQSGLKSLLIVLGSLETIPIFKILHTANNITGNTSSSPAYHSLHGYLEWKWIILSIFIYFAKKEATTIEESEVEEQIQFLLYDLVLLSISKFNRTKSANLIYTTPFFCSCIKEMWLLLQLELEQLHDSDRSQSFWQYFNKTLESIRDSKNIFLELEKTTVRRKVVQKLTPKNWLDFSVWILSGVSKLHGFDNKGEQKGFINSRVKENYDFLEGLTKNFLISDPNEERLRINLYLIIPIISDWWSPKTDIVLAYWEYFHKKLNSAFFIQGSTPSSLAVINPTVTGYLEQIKSKVQSESINPNETSYSIFTYLLGKILKKFALTEMSQIRKILGRITSKFSTTKLLALNETGIHNIVMLFLTLALTSNLEEMGQRLQNFLLQIPLSKVTPSRQIALMRGHIAMLLLFLEKRLNVSGYIIKILEQMNSISAEEGHVACMKLVADGLLEIFRSSEAFDKGEHLLLDFWLIKYMSACSYAEQERILECMNSCLVKLPTLLFAVETNSIVCSDGTTSSDINLKTLLFAIYKYILPYVKQLFGQKNVPQIVPELAANLCLCSAHASQNFDELFKYFVEMNCNSIQTLTSFLVIILSTDKLRSIEQSFIIRNWIKCSLCSNSTSSDLKALTSIVVSLEEFHVICDTEAEEIMNSNDSLCTFFSEIGQSYQNTTDFRKKYLISEKVYNYLSSFEKYTNLSLENPDNIWKIYSMIGIIILHCAQIVYIKGKSSCFFNVAMFQYILPNSLLTGKAQKPQVIQTVHKIWHLIIMGIEKLDFKNDAHLTKILINLIEKWLPHFKFTQNKQLLAKPFVNCLKQCNESMSTFVFEKMSTIFLVLQRRQPHARANLVLQIFSEILTACSNEPDKVLILFKSSSIIIIEHAMMADDESYTKNIIFDYFENIFKSSAYNNSADFKEIFSANLKMITSKNLAYYSSFYFQFMLKMVNINASAVQSVMDHLLDTIINVEHMRGVGRDGRLRNELVKLEGAIIAASVKKEKV